MLQTVDGLGVRHEVNGMLIAETVVTYAKDYIAAKVQCVRGDVISMTVFKNPTC